MKIKLLISVILLSFTCNNLLFGYFNSKITTELSSKKSECTAKESGCCKKETENECCSTDRCCRNGNTISSFSFSVIASNIIDKNFISFENCPTSNKIASNTLSGLCNGYLQSLIKPPLA